MNLTHEFIQKKPGEVNLYRKGESQDIVVSYSRLKVRPFLAKAAKRLKPISVQFCDAQPANPELLFRRCHSSRGKLLYQVVKCRPPCFRQQASPVDGSALFTERGYALTQESCPSVMVFFDRMGPGSTIAHVGVHPYFSGTTFCQMSEFTYASKVSAEVNM